MSLSLKWVGRLSRLGGNTPNKTWLNVVTLSQRSLSYLLNLAFLQVDATGIWGRTILLVQDDLMHCWTIGITAFCLLITENTPCRCDSQNNPKCFPNTSQLRAPCGASGNHYGVKVLQSESCLLGHEKANYVRDWIESPVLHLPARIAEKFTISFQMFREVKTHAQSNIAGK